MKPPVKLLIVLIPFFLNYCKNIDSGRNISSADSSNKVSKNETKSENPNAYYYKHPLFHLIDSASVNDKVYIKAGTYISGISLYINKPVCLVGLGRVNLICSDATDFVIYISYVGPGNVTIKNIHAKHAKSANEPFIGCSGSVVFCDYIKGSLIIDSCELNGCGANGIYMPDISENSRLTVKNSYIHSNSIAAILTYEDNEFRRINYGIEYPFIHFENNVFSNNGYKYKVNDQNQYIPFKELENQGVKLTHLGTFKLKFNKSYYHVWSLNDGSGRWNGIGLSEDSVNLIKLEMEDNNHNCDDCFDPTLKYENGKITAECAKGPSSNFVVVDNYYSINDFNLVLDSCSMNNIKLQ